MQLMDAMHAGAKIIAGTDEPNAFGLHGELESYVLAGMTPYEALKAATVNSAEALNLDAGNQFAQDMNRLGFEPIEVIHPVRRVGKRSVDSGIERGAHVWVLR